MRISDWSSDVCSSDLLSAVLLDTQRVWGLVNARIEPDWVIAQLPHLLARKHFDPHWSRAQGRSEERSVGKEWVSTCRSRWSQAPSQKNIQEEKNTTTEVTAQTQTVTKTIILKI